MKPFTHILVATDFERTSQRAVDKAAEIAEGVGAQLTLLHVVRLPPHSSRSVVAPYPEPARAWIAEKMHETVERLEKRGCRAHGIVRQLSAWDGIVAVADEVGADLVVLGTHGRRAVSRAVLGSVAEQVVRASTLPILTVSRWRYNDRTEAGRRLGQLVAPLKSEAPSVVALTRGGIPMGVEIGRVLGSSVDVLLVEALRSPEGLELGAVCEEGTSAFAACASQVGPEDLNRLVSSARDSLRERVHWLRGAKGLGAIEYRTVIVACDLIESPLPVVVGARVLRRLGAHRVVVAVPVCSRSAFEVLRREVDVDDVCSLEISEAPLDAVDVYRKRLRPSFGAAAELLLGVNAQASAAP